MPPLYQLRISQEPSDSQIVESGSGQASYQRRNHRDPPYFCAISEAVVAKSGKRNEKARTQIARRVDGISMHSSEAHTDGYDHQSDHQRSKVGARRSIELVGDREHEKK